MWFSSLVSTVALVASVCTTVHAYANPGACSGDCWAHDPAVVRRSDGTYFRFNTGSKIGIWKADDLTGPWVFQGAALPEGSSIPLEGNQDLWAPDVNLVGDTYIMYYTVSTSGIQNSAIGYATSPNMEFGSWTDHGPTGVRSHDGKRYNAIDANLISDGSSYYLNFGSFWDDIFQVPLNGDATRAAGVSHQLAYEPAGHHAIEGAYMYHREGQYYLFWSEGICCGYQDNLPASGEEYKIYVCRSSSVNGPFVDANGASCANGGGTVVLASHGNVYGPGGQGVFADPEHGTVLYYHYADKNVGLSDAEYRFGWNVINWSGGWPKV